MIGIFGGTFDPVHYGHIKPVLSVKQTLNLTQLRFIPNRIPPHRGTPWLSVAQRLGLLRCALSEYPDIVIDERELNRDGESYMVDTLASLHDEFPEQPLCLIIGMDAFSGINTWFKWRSIFELSQLVVTTRPGFDQSKVLADMDNSDSQFLAHRMTTDSDTFKAQESPQGKAQILLQSVPQLDISSTQIRDNLQHDEIIRHWMPAAAYRKLRGFIDED